MKIITIGFTEKKAERFFSLIKISGAKRVVDVRLNNVSQLSGFAKKDDLKYFLKELCDVDYVHLPELAPTKDILSPYQKKEITWQQYEDKFLNLMAKRNIEKHVRPEVIDQGCLLCSEHQPHQCHRRLVAEYLKSQWSESETEIKHLV
ncbi:MAG: DUF488 domain-containing protein [Pseudomonas sp.]|jgi:uncharacterized protein (DUF488 family)|uniref:DUF488 domain-containing protein n=1 Tax=Stutzerimonas frequens TaxID=2968969 RepID=UPI001267C618|nr:DUF488 domain-containing protein [Stutzerimonas frequens]MBA4727057.1 DUF488 domain-containing protein [Pseudomonas sp.]MBK3916367.1 DUF488 family protein [Stutzerimonas frequens]MEC7472089.1 DUF488 domain-containing protein [Pseudomonadota bacterium]QFU13144.1 hypothetical protein FIU84_14235 [Stutzerimonas frequens]|tara:strand:+ start:5054 stop:5497 length:444 start_codon:yes stop_codon:yes gene_type:complete